MSEQSEERELNFFMARVADQAERYEDVLNIMNEIIKIDPKLNPEERNLLSVAYKALTGARRSALRTVNAFLEDDNIKQIEARKNQILDLKKTLLKELDDYCKRLIDLTESKLYSAAEDTPTKVFYLKLVADYWRYSVEFKEGDDRKEGAKKAQEAYEKAREIAKELQKAKPAYLGLALNYSVFLYEILDERTEAIELADSSFKDAIDLLDALPEDEYSDATLILQLLKDNVALWKEENSNK